MKSQKKKSFDCLLFCMGWLLMLVDCCLAGGLCSCSTQCDSSRTYWGIGYRRQAPPRDAGTRREAPWTRRAFWIYWIAPNLHRHWLPGRTRDRYVQQTYRVHHECIIYNGQTVSLLCIRLLFYAVILLDCLNHGLCVSFLFTTVVNLMSETVCVCVCVCVTLSVCVYFCLFKYIYLLFLALI